MWFPVTDVAAFLAYAAAMSITPGPNNAMLATLGARHGWRGAAPAAAGVMVGMFGLLLTAGSGVGAVIAAAPQLRHSLALAGIAYMAYLAWALWSADPAPSEAGKSGPLMGFWSAAAFQLVNPKALLMALTAAGSFLIPAAGVKEAAAMATLFVAVGGPCVAVWALMGDRLRNWMSTPRRAQAFSRAMALFVAATALTMLGEG